jgi:hypothetical protein
MAGTGAQRQGGRVKNRIIALAIVAGAALAACQGGGTAPPPISTGTAAPSPSPIAYTARLIEVGGARTSNPSGYERLVQGARYTRDASFTAPVIMTAPASAEARGGNEYFAGGGDSSATLIAVVSPTPTSPLPVPVITTTVQGSVVAQATPEASPGVSQTRVDATAINTASVGVYVATYPTTVPQAQTQGLQYKRIALGGHATLQTYADHIIPGESFDANATATTQTDPTTSDVYITCKNCYGPFADPAAGLTATIHYRYGAILLTDPTGTGFTGLLSSQWVNATTAIDLDAIYNHPAGGAPTPLALFKTASGIICAHSFTKVNPGDGQPEITGPVKCHGTAIDGF